MPTPSIPPRRVLVIAYYFPPMGLSGVQRTLKFVKYLSGFGWHPTVLTVDPQGYFAKDETLMAELEGRNVTVVRTPPSGPARFFRKKDVVEIHPRQQDRMAAPCGGAGPGPSCGNAV
jgi:hypothetical protein